MELLELAQEELLRSNVDTKHPFRYFTLGTLDLNTNIPELRTVVKRGITNNFDLLFYTDTRSPKVEQIRLSPNVTAHFYDPEKMLQIRLKGKAEILSTDGLFYIEKLHSVQASRSKNDYMSLEAPGSVLLREGTNHSAVAVEYGEKLYFSVVRIHSFYLDVLLLDQAGHKRAGYRKIGETWQEYQLVP